MSIRKELNTLHRHLSTASGHIITMLVKRSVTRTQLNSALEHAKITVSRLELLIARVNQDG